MPPKAKITKEMILNTVLDITRAVSYTHLDVYKRQLLDSADSRFIPSRMFEKNEHGTYVNGHRLVTLIVCVLIVVCLLYTSRCV